jgi:hypothetical protein
LDHYNILFTNLPTNDFQIHIKNFTCPCWQAIITQNIFTLFFFRSTDDVLILWSRLSCHFFFSFWRDILKGHRQVNTVTQHHYSTLLADKTLETNRTCGEREKKSWISLLFLDQRLSRRDKLWVTQAKEVSTCDLRNGRVYLRRKGDRDSERGREAVNAVAMNSSTCFIFVNKYIYFFEYYYWTGWREKIVDKNGLLERREICYDESRVWCLCFGSEESFGRL